MRGGQVVRGGRRRRDGERRGEHQRDSGGGGGEMRRGGERKGGMRGDPWRVSRCVPVNQRWPMSDHRECVHMCVCVCVTDLL